ncbi:MAG TPA: polysaccharide biosynthesis/export family protein [Pyrinomonadaceae bacterium]|nr:polysaccharide biosynthesis/export family protein [Pyrinomonadaceae bacterium]
MKSTVFAALVLSASLAVTVSAQVKSLAAANNQTPSQSVTNQAAANATRVRVMSDNKGEPRKLAVVAAPPARTGFELNNHSNAGRARRADLAPVPASEPASKKETSPESSKVGHSSLNPNGSTKTSAILPQNAAASAAIAVAPTQIYRVGVGDVLDIQLSGNPARSSTLFTVLENGVLEYPLAGNPIVVSGMTPSEIADLLRQRIKVFEDPKVAVDVREYASHAVTVNGLVTAPGKKILRREALPLYALLAEALVLPEAVSATITRKGVTPIVVDLKDENLAATLVMPGDTIKVSGTPPAPVVTDFYFVGGEINSPGQKPYHAGITLTQSILASGGMKAGGGAKVRISRQAADGKLITEEFNLRKIQTGKYPDPILQKGDRVEITSSN